MNPTLLAIVACIYAYVAWGYYESGREGMFIAFAAYALSNIGFIVDAIRS